MNMMSMHKPSRTAPFLAGVVLGVLAAVFLPGLVRPYLPQWVMGKTVVVKGTVAAKQKKADALLLTVNTPEGVLLASFQRKVDEINLLINETDTIEFRLAKYMPFIDDPKIIRVVKKTEAVPEPVPAPAPKERGAREGRPGAKEKPAAPAPASRTTGTPPPSAPGAP